MFLHRLVFLVSVFLPQAPHFSNCSFFFVRIPPLLGHSFFWLLELLFLLLKYFISCVLNSVKFSSSSNHSMSLLSAWSCSCVSAFSRACWVHLLASSNKSTSSVPLVLVPAAFATVFLRALCSLCIMSCQKNDPRRSSCSCTPLSSLSGTVPHFVLRAAIAPATGFVPR